MSMKRELTRKRIRDIRRELNKKKIDCLIVTEPANVTYTTGFMGDDSWAIITKRAVYLLTDSRYTEQAQKECVGCGIVQRKDSMAEAAGKLLKKLKSVRIVAVEKSTSVAAFGALKKHVKLRLKTTAGIIESVRRIKDSSEINTIKAAASITARALRQIRRYMKTGVTESELAGRLDFEIRKLGARNSFDTIVAFGPNASRPHHQPSERRLRKKDTVLIDVGARYKGYCSDITRSFAIGRPTRFFEKVYEAVQQAQAAAIKTVKAGAEIKQVDAAAREVISKYDLPVYGHGSGHGFGLEIHEMPFLKADGKGKLKAGEVITIEPGVYFPGKLGVRIEDDILVTDTGHKILTHSCPQTLLQFS
jgi:Xaa-Pro aminopeptidase